MKTWAAGEQVLAADLNANFLLSVIGGTGADGALAISSGTTTLNIASAIILVKNYTSVSITGTAVLAFSNPASVGSQVVLKTTGAFTLSSSASPAIDMRGIGSAGGTGGTAGGGGDGTDGSQTARIIDALTTHGGRTGRGATAGSGVGGAAGTVFTTGLNSLYTDSADLIRAMRYYNIVPGTGGGGGGGAGAGTGNGGAGGRGGGALVIECGGTYTCSGIINAGGTAGSNGVNGDGVGGPGGGGGGGSGGAILVIYMTLGSDTGTYTVTGGAGGTKGTTPGASNAGGGGGGGGYMGTAGTAGSNATNPSGAAGDGAAGAAGLTAIRMLNDVF